IDKRGAAGDREAGLGLLRDDLDRQPGLARDAGDEVIAVGRSAASFGGDQPAAADLAVGKLAGAHLQRLDGAMHGALAELAGLADALAQADDARERVDD